MPLPPGTILNPATGEIAGIPTQAGTHSFQLKVRDLLGTQRVLDETITISPYTPMEVAAGYGRMMATRAFASTPTVTDGLAPITFALHAGSLPAGLSLNASTGAITGTPSTPGATSFTIRATDSLAQHIDIPYSLPVAANLVMPAHVPGSLTINVAYNGAAAAATGGTAPLAFALTAGSLPAGLSLNALTGAITGTPTALGTSSGIAITATDAYGFTAVASGQSSTIYSAAGLTGALTRGMRTRAYTGSYSTVGGASPFTWGATGLPPGLSINTSTGAITGTPSAVGTYDPLITVTDALGVQSSRSNQVVIAENLALSGAVPGATRGIAYSFTPTTAGGYPALTYALQSGSLPTGLSLNASNGAITGTPTVQQSTSAVLRVTDADNYTATLNVNITVAGDLSLSGTTPGTATVGSAYSGTTYSASGDVAPYTWSISSGALPNGLSLNTATGAITGTPTVAGTFNFTVRVVGQGGSFATDSTSITVAAALALSGTLPDATNGVAYSSGYTRAGGHSPFTWSISSGALPTGLSINASTGAITGTPSANGGFTFTVRVIDNVGNIATRSQTVTVYAAPGLSGTLTADAAAPYTNGSDGGAYSNGLTASGGKSPIAWSVSGSLPPGLSINASTGVISGTVGVVSEAGGTGYTDYVFNVVITDALGRQATSAQTIRVHWHVRLSGSYPAATQGVAYSQGITATYGKTPRTFALQAGTLPTGLSLNTSTGVISGTPSTSGSGSITVRVTDALGKTEDLSQTFVCYAAVGISGVAPDATVGVAYSYTYTGSGGSGAYTYSITAGALPAGLSLNTATGAVTGTPTTANTYGYTVGASSAGSSATVADSVDVYAFPTLSPTTPRGTVGYAYTGASGPSGGKNPSTYSISAGALPGGLSINSSTGAITGTPTTAGTYDFTIQRADALGNIATSARTVAIAAALAQIQAYAAGQQTVAYNSTAAASGGWSPYGYALQSGSLPGGLSLNTSTGAISGTPSATGTFNFTIRVTDADGNTVDTAKSIVISAAPVSLNVTISPSPCYEYEPATGQITNVTCSVEASVTGAVGALSYSWTLEGGGSSAFITSVSSNANKVLQKTAKFFYASEDWRCTVTDAGNGATAYAIVNVTGEIS